MNAISLIFPHQLFKNNPAIAKGQKIFLIEDELFFKQYSFHKHKLILHRASMQNYANHLAAQAFLVEYVEARDASLKTIFFKLSAENITTIHVVDPVDYLLNRRLTREAKIHNIKLVIYDSPNFISNADYLNNYFDQKKYFLTEFYIEQRKRLKILVEDDKPIGGKWTFDSENRKKMPASEKIPPPHTYNHKTVAGAISYVNYKFESNIGASQTFNFPTTYQEAEETLNRFLSERFTNYGIYQDAIVEENSFLFHSLLTPALNIGLLHPKEIIDTTVLFATKNHIPINSLEGFIRQIIGWREFVRAVYIREGVKERTRNFWNHKRKIPKQFWSGTTGIEPVDKVIHKIINTSYCNHIERLMVIGNFMLLCEFDPDEVYKWFMELFIDSYDWVMVPNVYGMSQFADGGLMSTKLYISGSNYILKMSNFKKGPWCEIWDALYWCFIDQHKEMFAKNPRMSMMVQQLKKMEPTRLKNLQQTKINFLSAFE